MTNVTRRHLALGIALTLARVRPAMAQNPRGGASGPPWAKGPSITVLGNADDSRIQLVRDAVQYWNRIFTELGTPFRLGAVAVTAGALPVDLLKDLSNTVVSRTAVPELPAIVYETQGDIIVALSEGNFVSFAARRPNRQKALVAIKSSGFFPMTLPNVARNVIAHELGHAIGLGHNSDPAMLMCGRPASCRPDLFASPSERYFPLTTEEKAILRTVYPADWQPH